MSGCNDCFNNCDKITPDGCIKYTGPNVDVLDIVTGDSLLSVIGKLSSYLLSLKDEISVEEIEESCALLSGYMGGSGKLVDLLTALIKSVCDLQSQITSVESALSGIESNYELGDCFVGVNNNSTHDVLQAAVTEMCNLIDNIFAIQTTFAAYVKIGDLDYYMDSYMEANVSTKHYTKMIPYVAVEFYDDLTGKFDVTGAGYGDWENIYLCNGNNGTPDKRGRIPVGCNAMGCHPYSTPETDPAFSENPNYELFDTEGSNTVSLSPANLPSHKHDVLTEVIDPGHKHLCCGDDFGKNKLHYITYGEQVNASYIAEQGNHYHHFYTKNSEDGSDNPQKSNIEVNVVVGNTGEGTKHNNIPPVMACHYIMYIPNE